MTAFHVLMWGDDRFTPREHVVTALANGRRGILVFLDALLAARFLAAFQPETPDGRPILLLARQATGKDEMVGVLHAAGIPPGVELVFSDSALFVETLFATAGARPGRA